MKYHIGRQVARPMSSSDWIALIAAVSAFINAMTTIAIAIAAYRQLKKISEQARINNDQNKKCPSIEACEKFDTDPVLEVATQAIWNKRKGPNDYSNVAEFEWEAIVLSNYHRSLYVESIIRDHMEPIIKAAVESFLCVEHCIFRKNDFQCLLKLYESWNRHATFYKNQ